MRHLIPALLALAPATALAQQPQPAPRAPQGETRAVPPGQAPAPRQVVGAPGTCQMTVNGGSRPCTSGLVYVLNGNGSVLLSVQSGRDVTIGFQGDGDRQDRPERYTLFLSRLHTSVSGSTAAKDVRGTCEIDVSADGRIWHRATCRATDRSNIETVMTFTGNGQQVTSAMPGTATPGTPAPAPRAAAPAAPAAEGKNLGAAPALPPKG